MGVHGGNPMFVCQYQHKLPRVMGAITGWVEGGGGGGGGGGAYLAKAGLDPTFQRLER